MNLEEQVYSVLVVSSSEKFNQLLPELLPVSVFSPVSVVSNINTARRALSERDFDIVIINSISDDDSGTAFAVEAAGRKNSVVLFLANAVQYNDIYGSLVHQGVFMLQKPVARQSFRVAADWLISARERIRKNEEKNLSIEEKMNEIRLINRAKWLLISELKMTEPDAHKYIEKQAMNRCVTKRKVAEEIIKTYE